MDKEIPRYYVGGLRQILDQHIPVENLPSDATMDNVMLQSEVAILNQTLDQHPLVGPAAL